MLSVLDGYGVLGLNISAWAHQLYEWRKDHTGGADWVWMRLRASRAMLKRERKLVSRENTDSVWHIGEWGHSLVAMDPTLSFVIDRIHINNNKIKTLLLSVHIYFYIYMTWIGAHFVCLNMRNQIMVIKMHSIHHGGIFVVFIYSFK